jgi:hypothetical protein
MHAALSTILAVVVALDCIAGLVRLGRGIRRQRIVAVSGAVAVKSLSHYAQRILRTLALPLFILAVLVLGYLAFVYFGPIKPIHEW